MNKNILIVLGGAILAAVLVAVLVQVTLGGKKGGDETAQTMTEILVASSDMKVGKELEEGDLRWQEWPEDNLFSGAIIREEEQKPEEALKGRLARSLTKDEPVLKNAILKETKSNFVAASLKEGERAVSIKVDAEIMVAGFISPGDFVDVLLTYRQDIKVEGEDDPRVKQMVDMNIKEYATETVLENIRVLAIDQMAERDKDDEKVKVGKTVTLAVLPEQAERLALANKMGDVVLSLRGVGDTKPREDKGLTVTDARMTSVNDEILEEYTKMKKQKGVKENLLKVYNGETISVMPVK
jgi:pilus assembly protein CpaB